MGLICLCDSKNIVLYCTFLEVTKLPELPILLIILVNTVTLFEYFYLKMFQYKVKVLFLVNLVSMLLYKFSFFKTACIVTITVTMTI